MPASEPVRFTTYNLLNLFAADTAEAWQHYETIAGAIRALDADVLAVQEILAPDEDEEDTQHHQKQVTQAQRPTVLLLGALMLSFAFALAFDNAHVDDYGIPRREIGNRFSQASDFFLFQRIDDIHRIFL